MSPYLHSRSRSSQRGDKILCSETTVQHFPVGAVVKNLPANGGDMGSTLDPGRSHMPQGNKAHGPPASMPQSPCSTREATAVRRLSTTTTVSSPSWPQLESSPSTRECPLAATKTQHSQTFLKKKRKEATVQKDGILVEAGKGKERLQVQRDE